MEKIKAKDNKIDSAEQWEEKEEGEEEHNQEPKSIINRVEDESRHNQQAFLNSIRDYKKQDFKV